MIVTTEDLGSGFVHEEAGEDTGAPAAARETEATAGSRFEPSDGELLARVEL